MTIIGSSEINITEPNRLAEKLMAERYSFSPTECPWEEAYWASSLPDEATYYTNHMVPEMTRMYRMSWLAGAAQGLLFARKNKLVSLRDNTPASMWGVVECAILEGTYACIFTKDRDYLWTGTDLSGVRLGISGLGLPDCTSRNIEKQLANKTDSRIKSRLYNREKKTGSYHSPFVYYVRVDGRKMFTRDELIKQAIYVARNQRKDTMIAQTLLRQWYEVFDHTSELIEYFMDLGEGSMITPDRSTNVRFAI